MMVGFLAIGEMNEINLKNPADSSQECEARNCTYSCHVPILFNCSHLWVTLARNTSSTETLICNLTLLTSGHEPACLVFENSYYSRSRASTSPLLTLFFLLNEILPTLNSKS